MCGQTSYDSCSEMKTVGKKINPKQALNAFSEKELAHLKHGFKYCIEGNLGA